VTKPLLAVSDLHAWYGKSHVLQGVSFSIQPGEIVSLLGRNGSGRTTTALALMGGVRAEGSVRFQGAEILGLPPHEIAQRGIGIVVENRDIFPTLTVRQNLVLGKKGGSENARWLIDDIFGHFPHLAARADVPASVLSGGEKQMLAMCRTLMGNPTLMVVDEPTEGLAPQVVATVADLLADIAGRGTAILLIEQKLTIALSLAHRHTVMGHGKIVFDGNREALDNAPNIVKEWLEV
jgi:branched-chain amino acid transport system ATP-binding protein